MTRAPSGGGDTTSRGHLIASAFRRGQAALERGDPPEGLRWLDRAHRLDPANGTITIALATASLATDPDRAASLFAASLAVCDSHEAHLGLVTAAVLMGDIAAAEGALSAYLNGHAPHPGTAALADQISRLTGAPGWCALSGAGVVEVHTPASDPVEIRMDGRKIASQSVLPPRWRAARAIDVTMGGRPLIGSPLIPAAIIALSGAVEVSAQGLHLVAWHPADPARNPTLYLRSGSHKQSITLTEAADIDGWPPLAQPRAGFIPWCGIPGGDPVIRVTDPSGFDLQGSPMTRPLHNNPPPARPPRAIPAVGAITVFLHFEDLDAILPTIPPGTWLVVLNDPSVNKATEAGHVLRLPRGGSVNPAHTFARKNDIVLLTPGARTPSGWLERLANAAHGAPEIATAAPFSNALTARDGQETLDLKVLDRLAKHANKTTLIDGPTAAGPCLFIRAECVPRAPAAWADLLLNGASAWQALQTQTTASGWRHVIVPGVYCSQRHTDDQLERMPSTLEAARKFDLARWRHARRTVVPGVTRIFITHDDGGGVAQRVDAALATQWNHGGSAIVLRPCRMPDGTTGVAVDDGHRDAFPNLRFAIPTEDYAFTRLLRQAHASGVVIHHFLNHNPGLIEIIQSSRFAIDVHIHDYIWFCPRIALVGDENRYCGEPAPAACDLCIARNGSFLPEIIGVEALIDRSRALLNRARKVIAPSEDAANRMRLHFPGITVTVVPHEHDEALPAVITLAGRSPVTRVCVAGAIGLHKGFDVLLACARDARERGLALSFIVAGHTIDDQTLIDTGHVFITGQYEPAEAAAVIRAHAPVLGFLPSIWPETWCLALTDLWRAGLTVAAFDIGAQAERIRRTGRGFLLPLDLPAAAINDALLDAAAKSLTAASAQAILSSDPRLLGLQASQRCNPE